MDSYKTLLEVLQAMGAKQSNPVLEVIANSPLIELEKKYPEDPGFIGNHYWRAFYHCHDSPGKPAQEHGHFHIFINSEGDSDTSRWSHLAGLSMNNMGQPFQWFTVNQWVTSGPWLNAPNFDNVVMSDDGNEPLSLVEKWLQCMMMVFRVDIGHILDARDAYIKNCSSGEEQQEVFNNRDIYLLSTKTLDLQNILNARFSGYRTENIDLTNEVNTI